MSNKNAQTLQPRHNYLVKFIKNIKLGNNLVLAGYNSIERNLPMSCYTTKLATEET